jgi:GT2 family glycosyltransferase
VTLILPTGGRLELLQPCLESLFAKTSYPNYEVSLVDNSKASAVCDYVRGLDNHRISYLDWRNRQFNYSALNNYAVRQSASPLVLFLNDDTTIIEPDWLTAMVEHGQRPSVGIVGAKLLFPFGLIQHAGVVMGIYENTAHAFRHLPGDSRAYFDFPQIVRNCSAVTAACMLTKRDLFLKLGGFDETNLAVAFQDVDYCLRVVEAGYFVIYTPYSVLLHHESVTKDEKLAHPREVRYMQQKWRKVIENDPFYSPHLTRTAEDYSIRID